MIIDTFSIPCLDYRFIASVLILKQHIVIHKNVSVLLCFHGQQYLKHSAVKTRRYNLNIRTRHCIQKSNYRIIYIEVHGWLLYVYCKHTSKRKIVIEHVVIWNTLLVCKLILHNQHSTSVVQELFTFLFVVRMLKFKKPSLNVACNIQYSHVEMKDSN